MKKLILPPLISVIICALFTFAGSVLGNALGRAGLFAGAFSGGIFGIIIAVRILGSTNLIRKAEMDPVALWEIIFYCIAVLFSVTNLGTPWIPVFTILYVAIGYYCGKSVANKKAERIFNFRMIFAIILTVPAIYFLVASVFKYEIGLTDSFTLIDWLLANQYRRMIFNLVSPVLFLGGGLLSLWLIFPVRNFNDFRKLIKVYNFNKLPLPGKIVVLLNLIALSVLSIYLIGENL